MAGWSRFGVGVAAVLLASCGAEDLSRAPYALLAEPSQIGFGPTALGRKVARPLLLRNEGRAAVRVSSASSSAEGLELEPIEPFRLQSGQARELAVTFSPAVEGQVLGVLALETDAENAEEGLLRIPAEGLGVRPAASLSPDRLDFGDLEIGTARDMRLVLSNPSGAEVSARLELEGPDRAMFQLAELGQELLLGPGEGRSLTVTFAPSRLAAAQASMRAEICPSCEPRRVELGGFGISSIVDVKPLRIQFGRVAPGGRAEEKLTITNLGSEPLQFGGLSWVDQPPAAFSVEPVAAGDIPAGGRVVARVVFAPRDFGAVSPALLQVRVAAKNSAGIKVPVSGEVGNPCVVPLPSALDFGLVPEGMTATRRVDLVNRCGQPVQVDDFEALTTQGGFFGLAQSGLSLSLGKGAIGSVPVSFTPKPGSGVSTGRLSFEVRQNGVLTQGEVALSGSTRAMAPCRYSMVPPALDFGLVQVGSEVSLGVAIRNEGSDLCFVSSMQLASGTDAPFSSPGSGPSLLAPGETALLRISFKPLAEGTFRGLAEGWVNSSTAGRATAPVSGKGVQGCFQLQPATIDFGTLRLSCGPKERSVVALNNCSAAVTLSSAGIRSATSSELSLSSGPALPYLLARGAQVAFGVRYAPSSEGEDAAGLAIEAGQGGQNTVGLVGRAVLQATQTDRFLQGSQSQVDVLFVIDNSGSMMEEQQSLAQNFASLLSAAQGSGADYHIGVTTTGLDPSPGGWSVCPGGVDGGEGGRLFPVLGSTPRIITPSTPNAAQVFAANVQVGWCHWNEQGLEAAYRALSEPLVSSVDDPRTSQPGDGNQGFLRRDAKLAIVVVTDEEDFSSQPVEFYLAFFQALKSQDPALLSFSAIVGPSNLASCPTASSSGTRYIELAQKTGGVVESICTQNWSDSLKKISSSAFGLARRFPLNAQPGEVSSIEVEVNGQQVTSWSYEPSSNSILFEEGAAPPAGAAIDVTYSLGC